MNESRNACYNGVYPMSKHTTFSSLDACDVLRVSAQDMAQLLSAMLTQLQAEPGLVSHISRQRIEDALARHACADQLVITAKATTTVRVHKLAGMLETNALSELLSTRHPDAENLVTARIARRWVADAYRAAAAQVRAHFPDHIQLPQAQPVSAHAH